MGQKILSKIWKKKEKSFKITQPFPQKSHESALYAWKFLLQIGPTLFGTLRSLGPNKVQVQDDDVKPDEPRLIITALKRHKNIRKCNFKPVTNVDKFYYLYNNISAQ